MKIRNGFVSNSSSSSFIIVKLGEKTILENGDTELEHCGTARMSVDKLIAELEEAKKNGIENIVIMHGGGYEG